MALMNAVQVAEPGADLVMVLREIPEPESAKSSSRSRPVGSVTAMRSRVRARSPGCRTRACPATRW